MKAELQQQIGVFLRESLHIEATSLGDYIAVDRDSMCNIPPFRQSRIMHEMGAYPAVLKALKDRFDSSHCQLYWSSKTDEYLVLDNLIYS